MLGQALLVSLDQRRPARQKYIIDCIYSMDFHANVNPPSPFEMSSTLFAICVSSKA